jgi:hypothetical protein
LREAFYCSTEPAYAELIRHNILYASPSL